MKDITLVLCHFLYLQHFNMKSCRCYVKGKYIAFCSKSRKMNIYLLHYSGKIVEIIRKVGTFFTKAVRALLFMESQIPIISPKILRLFPKVSTKFSNPYFFNRTNTKGARFIIFLCNNCK